MVDEIPQLEQLLASEPANWIAWARLASAHLKNETFGAAKNAIKSALEIQENEPMLYGLLSDIEMELGNLDQAIAANQNGLELAPEHPELNSSLGLKYLESGKTESAIIHLRRTIEIEDSARHRFNLGSAYQAATEYHNAIDQYRLAIAADASYVRARRNLALCLVEVDRPQDAAGELLAATQCQPDHAHTWFMLGFVKRLLDDHDSAASSFEKCIDLDEQHDQAWEMWGRLLFESGQITAAQNVFERWLKVQPGQPIAIHMLEAITQSTKTTRASKEYVTAAFDQFADSFGKVLDKLQYRTPELIGQMVQEIPFNQNAVEFKILDAGCGTGLCGPWLKINSSTTLTGVDLSEKMIEHARRTEHYDELVVADLVEFFAHHRSHFDLIVASDTFNYFGELEGLFKALRDALVDRGFAIFTLENSESTDDFSLDPSGRFKHAEAYVHEALVKSCLSILKTEETVLRVENDTQVQGTVFVVQAEQR